MLLGYTLRKACDIRAGGRMEAPLNDNNQPMDAFVVLKSFNG
ncbi:MAG: hypothetical protein ACR5K4_04380 [Sodalis sp. (in: enterobacteria)]